MTDAPAIAFEDVSKRYGETAKAALDHVSLTIAQGEFIALVGQSGSGKSTLLSMINRLIDPSEGVVRFDGEDVRELDPIALRRRIGYVFQDIGLFPHMTLAENIAITPRLLGWDQRAAGRARRRIAEPRAIAAGAISRPFAGRIVRRPAPAHRRRARDRRASRASC